MAELKSGMKNNQQDFTLADIFRIIGRRKWVLIGALVVTTLAAAIVSLLMPPVYEAAVAIKKEATPGKKYADQLEEILILQSTDDIETEMEIVRSRNILEAVVSRLHTNFIVKKIEFAYSDPIELNFPYFAYLKYLQQNQLQAQKLPRVKRIQIDQAATGGEFEIKSLGSNVWQVLDVKSGAIKELGGQGDSVRVSLDGVAFLLHWPDCKGQNRLLVQIVNGRMAIEQLARSVSVEQVRKTNIFKIKVRSRSAKVAAALADEVARQYIQTRVEQEKQTIRYSFQFIDDQLKNISGKLEEAARQLSQFKSSNQVVSLDESSRETIRFLGELEAEKVNTELKLTEYRNKYRELRKAISEKGFIDQTYLNPSGSMSDRSPFSVLLQQLSDAELRRIELLQKRTESHPDVKAVDDQIAKIRRKLENYNENTLDAYSILINSLEKKLENINEVLAEYTDRLRTLPAKETRLAELTRKKNVYEKIFTLLLDKREEMRMAELSQLQDVVIVDPAVEPLEPVSPKRRLNVLAGAVFGMVLGLFLVFLVELQSRRIGGVEELEEAYNLRVLAVVPRYDRTLRSAIEEAESLNERFVNLREDQMLFRESYRYLRTKLSNLYPNSANFLFISSCEPGTGKSSVTINLGISMARSGKRVLIIDADLKRSRFMKYFNMENNQYGLGDYLQKNIKLPIYRPFGTKNGNAFRLDVIPAGPYVEGSSELLGSDKMQKLVLAAARQYDQVLIDTPPMNALADAFILGKFVKNLILLVRPGHTLKENLEWALKEISEHQLNLLGVVVNAYDLKKSADRYRFRYVYGYSKYGKDEKNA
ncbi:MAG: hypothetical protein Kow0037_29300 [Calditrichia bacterium]